MFVMSARITVLIAVLMTAINVPFVGAQGSVFATLSGTVRDASESVIPDAAVLLVLVATNAEQRTVTDARGQYAFPRVAPGVYSLRIEKAGFRPSLIGQITLAVNDALTQPARQSCSNLLPQQLRPVLGAQN